LNRPKHLSPDYSTEVFEEARRTRLPTGSVSPEKGRTPEPDARGEDDTLVKMKSESLPPVKHDANGDLAEDRRQRAMTSMSPGESRDNCKCPLSTVRGFCMLMTT
jgi:hypothetical protein